MAEYCVLCELEQTPEGSIVVWRSLERESYFIENNMFSIFNSFRFMRFSKLVLWFPGCRVWVRNPIPALNLVGNVNQHTALEM